VIFRFRDCEIDSGRYELRRAGAAVAVEPKVLDLLLHLVRERDRLVTKQDLLDAVWPGVHVAESTLTRAVSLARAAVGDSAQAHAVIETVSGRGYRWKAPVEVSDGSGGSPRGRSRAVRAGAAVATWVVAIALLLVLTWPRPIGWALAWSGAAQPPEHPALPREPSLVVLPFTDLSPNEDRQRLAEGIAEDLTWGLVRFPELFVISPRSAALYRRGELPLAAIAHELGIRYAVEGSIRVDGERMVINAHLSEATTGVRVWSDRIETRLGDVLVAQARLAKQIVDVLGARIGEAESERLLRRPTESFDAYELFLSGRARFYAFTRDDHAEARRLFERAIELEPSYELPLAYLAATELSEYVLGWDPRPQRLEAALALARQARELDPFEPMPYTVEALANLIEGRSDIAGTAARRAVELGPNSDFCYGVKAAVHASDGQPLEAIRSLNRALRLNPRHPEFYWMLAGYLHQRAGQPDLARELFERIRDANADMVPPRLVLALHHFERGELQAARSLVDEVRAINPDLTAELALRIYAPARGDPGEAERAVVAWRAVGLP
jgi:TolB-like protein/DNA-binding winged helix-turn-helix (wHTH) protein/Tfp pilus assembly protein PilF